ncbi:hypothetical protein D3C81_643230 [compost metagenome]
MLVVGDVEKQRQLCVAVVEVDAQAAVVDATGVQGAEPDHLRRVGQAGLAVEPDAPVTATNAHGKVGLVAEFGLQSGQARGEAGWAIYAFEHLAQQRQAAVEQLLVEFDEVSGAGAAEEDAGGQRHHCSAGGKQQRQAAPEGQATHQAPRSSST